MDRSKLLELVDSLADPRILVIGDLILDRYLFGEVERLSPEAPVPVLDYQRDDFVLGGAANVAHNIASMGGKAIVAGVMGKDQQSEVFKTKLQAKGICVSGVVEDPTRPTTVKTRVIGDKQQIVRVDREKRHSLRDSPLKELQEFVEDALAEVSAVVISDYGKGVISPELLDGIRASNERCQLPVVVDPKDTHFSNYRGFRVITPNLSEASLGAGFKIKDRETLLNAGKRLLDELSCGAILITRGAQGMSLFMPGNEVLDIPTRARDVFDVTGAGDTVVALLSLALASQMSIEEAANLANWSAGVVVAKYGTATVNGQELKAYLERFAEDRIFHS